MLSPHLLVYHHLRHLLHRRFRPTQRIFRQQPLHALDLNRWEWNALFCELEVALSVELNDATLRSATTIAGLVAGVAQQLSPK